MRGEEPEATAEESVLAKHVDAGYQVRPCTACGCMWVG